MTLRETYNLLPSSRTAILPAWTMIVPFLVMLSTTVVWSESRPGCPSPRIVLPFSPWAASRERRAARASASPSSAFFFNQPTQIPLDVLHRHAVDNTRPKPAEAAKVMQENSAFWKAEIQSLGNQYLQAVISDPKLMVLQNAALYNQLKRFLGEER